MPSRHVLLAGDVPQPLAAGFEKLRAELDVPAEFSPEVLAAAAEAATSPRLPDVDLTDVEFVTIDPPGAKDLDQALHLSRQADGWLVRYAIADPAAFIEPGGVIDLETHRRGQTFYAPHRRFPLHPPVLSEDAASLLADGDRPAQVWEMVLDSEGSVIDSTVRRAMVRSRAQLDYAGVQKMIDDGTAPESLALLKDVGLAREERERVRGGVSLPLPEQEVHVTESGRWRLGFRSPLPVEGWNAQISLLTGMAAASMMMYGEVGLVRTLPPAQNEALLTLRRTAGALGISWPSELDYPEFVRSLDASVPAEAAMLHECTTLFRGADYQAFSGSIPQQASHAALAASYAHVTAPLRRLVDRYAAEICLALCAGEEPPQWVTSVMDQIPEMMRDSNRRAKAFERGIVNRVEALVLSGRVGQRLQGTVVDVGQKDGTVVIASPAVELKVKGEDLPLGQVIEVEVASVDLTEGTVDLQLV